MTLTIEILDIHVINLLKELEKMRLLKFAEPAKPSLDSNTLINKSKKVKNLADFYGAWADDTMTTDELASFIRESRVESSSREISK